MEQEKSVRNLAPKDEEGAAEATCDNLTVTPHPLALLEGRRWRIEE